MWTCRIGFSDVTGHFVVQGSCRLVGVVPISVCMSFSIVVMNLDAHQCFAVFGTNSATRSSREPLNASQCGSRGTHFAKGVVVEENCHLGYKLTWSSKCAHRASGQRLLDGKRSSVGGV